MKIKQTLLLWTLLFSLCGSFFAASVTVSAESCDGVDTSIIHCDKNTKLVCADGTAPAADGKCTDGSSPTADVTTTGVWSLLLIVINFLTAGISVVAIGGIAYAAVLYASAGGSVEQVKKAVKIIMNIIAGAVMYALAWSLLNWLIPGGAF